MAQEAPNVLHAAAVFDGSGLAPVIARSRGIVDAGAVKNGPGAYLLPLVDPVDPTAVVCSGGATDGGGHSLIMDALIIIVGPTDYRIGILCLDDTGAPTDAVQCQVLVTKFATDD